MLHSAFFFFSLFPQVVSGRGQHVRGIACRECGGGGPVPAGALCPFTAGGVNCSPGFSLEGSGECR